MAVGAPSEDDQFLTWTQLDNIYCDHGSGLEAVRYKEYNELRLPRVKKLSELRLPKAFWTKLDVVFKPKELTAEGVIRPKNQRASRGRGRLRHPQASVIAAARRPGSDSGSGKSRGSGDSRLKSVERLSNGLPMDDVPIRPNDQAIVGSDARFGFPAANGDFQESGEYRESSADVRESHRQSPLEASDVRGSRTAQDLMAFSHSSRSAGSFDADADDRFSEDSDSDQVCPEVELVDEMDRLPERLQEPEPELSWPANRLDIHEPDSGSDLFLGQSVNQESNAPWPANRPDVINISNTPAPLFPDQDFASESGLVTQGFVVQEFMYDRGASRSTIADHLEAMKPSKKNKKKKQLKLVNSLGQDIDKPPETATGPPAPRSYSEAAGFKAIVDSTMGVPASPPVQRAPVQSQPPSFDLIVENLNQKAVSPQKLKEIFEVAGDVRSVNIRYADRDSKTTSAKISYNDEDARNWAVEVYNGAPLGGIEDLGTVTVYSIE